MIIKLALAVLTLIQFVTVTRSISVGIWNGSTEVCRLARFTLDEYVAESKKLDEIFKLINLEKLERERLRIKALNMQAYSVEQLREEVREIKLCMMVALSKDNYSIPYGKMYQMHKGTPITIEQYDAVMYEYFANDDDVTHLVRYINLINDEIFRDQLRNSASMVPAIVKVFVLADARNMLKGQTLLEILRKFQDAFFDLMTMKNSYVWKCFDIYVKAVNASILKRPKAEREAGMAQNWYPNFYYGKIIMDDVAFNEIWPRSCGYVPKVDEITFRHYYAQYVFERCQMTRLECMLGLITLQRIALISLDFDKFVGPFIWKTMQHCRARMDYSQMIIITIRMLAISRKEPLLCPGKFTIELYPVVTARIDYVLQKSFTELSNISDPREFASRQIRKMKYFYKMHHVYQSECFTYAICWAAMWAEAYDLPEVLYGNKPIPIDLGKAQFLEYTRESDEDQECRSKAISKPGKIGCRNAKPEATQSNAVLKESNSSAAQKEINSSVTSNDNSQNKIKSNTIPTKAIVVSTECQAPHEDEQPAWSLDYRSVLVLFEKGHQFEVEVNEVEPQSQADASSSVTKANVVSRSTQANLKKEKAVPTTNEHPKPKQATNQSTLNSTNDTGIEKLSDTKAERTLNHLERVFIPIHVVNGSPNGISAFHPVGERIQIPTPIPMFGTKNAYYFNDEGGIDGDDENENDNGCRGDSSDDSSDGLDEEVKRVFHPPGYDTPYPHNFGKTTSTPNGKYAERSPAISQRSGFECFDTSNESYEVIYTSKPFQMPVKKSQDKK